MDVKYLNREEAPLEPGDWELIDSTIVNVARRILVGRRFLNLYGPLGAGVQDVDYDTFTGTGAAQVEVFGETETSFVRAEKRVHENIPIIYKDFMLYWRDIETSRQIGAPIDVSAAAAAAAIVAQKEDDIIFNGDKTCNYEGLTNASGRNVIGARDWAVAGNGYLDVVDARAQLLAKGFYGPYAVVLSPLWHASLHRVYANSGVLEINHVRELATAGVYQTPALKDGHGVILSVGFQNFDITVAQDLVTAYLGVERMNHPFRVFESLVLRLKRPGAICTIEPAAA
jgi:uncharacterized linocin/CFP29 family protein